MADNLDDFFAKKEKKKKGKSKSKKYTTTDELVKTFETEETEPSEKSQTQQEKTASERNKVLTETSRNAEIARDAMLCNPTTVNWFWCSS